jgi:TfoX/Sxy family transcriptional regulator of competence genes
MAYDETLAARVRSLLAGTDYVVEKKMFGGLAFLVRGNMSLGIHESELIVRIDAAQTVEALKRPGTRIFDLSGRPMKGWLLVSSKAVVEKKSLSQWVDRAVAFAISLPA